MSEQKRLLIVLAHPDDESFGMGGTIALYAAQGVEVYLVCATRGEVGTVDPEYMEGFESVGELREHELRCAAESLGVKELFFLDYRDSGMEGSEDNGHPNALAAQPVDQVAAKVVKYIREIKPHTVVTFDPDGGYRHPDHIAIHKAALRAYQASGNADEFKNGLAPYQAEQLFYVVFPRKALKVGIRMLKLIGRDPAKFGRNKDINLVALTNMAEFPLHVKINTKQVAETRAKAYKCHASQLDFTSQMKGWMKIFSKYIFNSSTDYYTQVFPPIPDDQRGKSLFE